MLTVTNARNQRGWSGEDHLLDDERILRMVGRDYKDLATLRRAADRLAESFPSVDYTDGVRLYHYDGSPTGIPGNPVQVITDLGLYRTAPPGPPDYLGRPVA